MFIKTSLILMVKVDKEILNVSLHLIKNNVFRKVCQTICSLNKKRIK